MHRFPPVPGLAAAAAASACGARFDELLSPARGSRGAARARQFAVYLHLIALGDSVSACARAFGRDRATVRHACARIEDLREEARVDHCLARLETALAAYREMVLSLAGGAA